jgi:hypothetical protein
MKIWKQACLKARVAGVDLALLGLMHETALKSMF